MIIGVFLDAIWARFDFKIPVPKIISVGSFEAIKNYNFSGRKLFVVPVSATLGIPDNIGSFSDWFIVEAIKTAYSFTMCFDGRDMEDDVPARYIYESGLNDSWFKLRYTLF